MKEKKRKEEGGGGGSSEEFGGNLEEFGGELADLSLPAKHAVNFVDDEKLRLSVLRENILRLENIQDPSLIRKAFMNE